MSEHRILVAPGDGVGPEVTAEAIKVLAAVSERFGHRFSYTEELVGGAAIDAHGTPLRKETLDAARDAEAVLFGAVGDPRFDDPQNAVRPEQAILGLRKGLDLFANLRPVRVFPELQAASTLREEVVAGTDLVVVRELTGGLYFGEPKKRWSEGGQRQAVDTLRYDEGEIERAIRVGFRLAQQRRRRVSSVDKANVLESGRLWREIATEVAWDFPDVELEHVLVDAAAMHLVQRPTRFDVIVTENTFGDILTDEASVLTGSLGMLPSASVGAPREDGTSFGLYEPIHGSAPDIAGRGIANPLGAVLSAAMLLRISLGLAAEAAAIEEAVGDVLRQGLRTRDLARDGGGSISTSGMGDAIAARLGAAPEPKPSS